jgi:hypothetical protein
MKKIIRLLTIFIILSLIIQAEFEKLDKIEMKMFGYRVSKEKSLDERISALEVIIAGGISEGNIDVRINKISDFILKDGMFLSPSTKIGKIELFLFKNIEEKVPLLERVEKIESFLFKKIDNKQPISSRVTRIYGYVFETREEIILSGDIFKKKSGIKLKPLTDILSVQEGEEIYFTLLEDIKGIAKSGSKVRGKVLRIEKKEKSEILKVMIYEIINEELREINIYKKAEIILKDKRIEKGYEIEEIGIIG